MKKPANRLILAAALPPPASPVAPPAVTPVASPAATPVASPAPPPSSLLAGSPPPTAARDMCLRCSKRLGAQPGLRCLRFSAFVKCDVCKAGNKPCLGVPQEFSQVLKDLQELGARRLRGDVDGASFEKAAKRYVTDVEAFLRKDKKKVVAGSAPVSGGSLTHISKRLGQVVELLARSQGTTLEALDKEAGVGFHAGELKED